MKKSQEAIVEIVRAFMCFIGKVKEVKEKTFVVFYNTDVHGLREFSLPQGLELKINDIIFISIGGIVLIENDDELKKAICATHEIEDKQDWKDFIDTKIEQIKMA